MNFIRRLEEIFNLQTKVSKFGVKLAAWNLGKPTEFQLNIPKIIHTRPKKTHSDMGCE